MPLFRSLAAGLGASLEPCSPDAGLRADRGDRADGRASRPLRGRAGDLRSGVPGRQTELRAGRLRAGVRRPGHRRHVRSRQTARHPAGARSGARALPHADRAVAHRGARGAAHRRPDGRPAGLRRPLAAPTPGAITAGALVAYRDPQGRLSISAPSDWASAVDPQALFGTGVFQFHDPSGRAEVDVAVDTVSKAVSPELYAASMELAMTQQVPCYAAEPIQLTLTSGNPSLRRVFTFTSAPPPWATSRRGGSRSPWSKARRRTSSRVGAGRAVRAVRHHVRSDGGKQSHQS